MTATPNKPPYPYRRTICVLLILLVIIHGFYDQFFKVDSASLALIGLAILVFYLPMIRKFKWNSFEAEINARDITEVAQVVQKLPQTEQAASEAPEVDMIRRLLDDSPTLALAQLRMTIEKHLVSLIRVVKPKILNPHDAHVSLSKLLLELYRENVLNIQTYAAAKDVVAITNRAIHGEAISRDNAAEVVELGAIVIQALVANPTTSTQHAA